jgi:hypothetical protein
MTRVRLSLAKTLYAPYSPFAAAPNRWSAAAPAENVTALVREAEAPVPRMKLGWFLLLPLRSSGSTSVASLAAILRSCDKLEATMEDSSF